MLGKYTLLRSQRKRIFEVLREVGLEPADFSWSEKEELGGSIVVSKLHYQEGTYYFQFSWYELSSWCVLSPGRYRSLEYEHPMNWKEQEASFRAWAQCLKREIESPDPWAEMAKYRIAVGADLPEKVLNEPICAYEAEQVIKGLARLAARIETELSPSQQGLALVRAKLEYLAEAVKRQRSRDWVYGALGVCVTMAMGLSQPPERAGTLWQLMKAEIGQFIPWTIRGPGSSATLSASRIVAADARSAQSGIDHRVIPA
jgi:hypothetical protein